MKTTENLRQCSLYPGGDLSPGYAEREVRMLSTQQLRPANRPKHADPHCNEAAIHKLMFDVRNHMSHINHYKSGTSHVACLDTKNEHDDV
jgi:hypothetical protein